jgi:methionine-gamma-lyase
MPKRKGFSTRSVDSGELKGISGSVITPIFQTSTFFYPTEDESTWRGEIPAGTYIYSRQRIRSRPWKGRKVL